jgi:hypothetical protein
VLSSRSPAYCGSTLAREDSHRLPVARGFTSRIGIEDFAPGKHSGQKRLTPLRALPHPEVRCPDSLFQIIDPSADP